MEKLNPPLKNSKQLPGAPQLLQDASTPLFGQKMGCGLFGISDDFIEDYQSLDQKFIKNQSSTFFFEAIGDSMSPTINEKDILVVDRSIKNYLGKVCIVAYNGELTCKRIILKAGIHLLYSDNQKYSPIKLEDFDDAFIWGVVRAKACEMR